MFVEFVECTRYVDGGVAGVRRLKTPCRKEWLVVADWLWNSARAMLKGAVNEGCVVVMPHFLLHFGTGTLLFANIHGNVNLLLLLVHIPLISRLSPTDNWFLVKNKHFFVSLLWCCSIPNLGKIFHFCSLGFTEDDDRQAHSLRIHSLAVKAENIFCMWCCMLTFVIYKYSFCQAEITAYRVEFKTSSIFNWGVLYIWSQNANRTN